MMTPETNNKPIISFENVTKEYYISQRATPRVGAWFLNKAFEYLRREKFQALDDLSLSISRGEMIGLLGANGAGKSSVLKLIAGITQPTRGTVTVHGSVTSLLELGVGFHPDLSGMENIFYNGSLMGMKRQQILEKLEEIIRFSGLADFLYEPVKHYSSGMYSRLACSVALHLDPEIILVDEILAVGDSEFQQRGILKILELHEKGVTVLLVTHETSTARDLCDRLIWLEKGKLRKEGDPVSIHNEYVTSMLSRAQPDDFFHTDLRSNHSGKVTLEGFEFEKTSREFVKTGEGVRLNVNLSGQASSIYLDILCVWEDGRRLFRDRSRDFPLEGEMTAVYQIERWPLLTGKVYFMVAVVDGENGELMARSQKRLEMETKTPGFLLSETLVNPDTVWTFERVSI